MMENILWDSLSSGFKIESTESKDEFQRGQENDGPLLWDFIRRRMNPATTVGVSKLKDEMEAMKPSKFDKIRGSKILVIRSSRKKEMDTMSTYARCSERTFLDPTQSLWKKLKMKGGSGFRATSDQRTHTVN